MRVNTHKSAACSFGHPTLLVNSNTGISKQIIRHVYPLIFVCSAQHSPTEHNEGGTSAVFNLLFLYCFVCVVYVCGYTRASKYAWNRGWHQGPFLLHLLFSDRPLTWSCRSRWLIWSGQQAPGIFLSPSFLCWDDRSKQLYPAFKVCIGAGDLNSGLRAMTLQQSLCWLSHLIVPRFEFSNTCV